MQMNFPCDDVENNKKHSRFRSNGTKLGVLCFLLWFNRIPANTCRRGTYTFV